MSYSNNPLLPKARADAVRLVVELHLPVSVAARKSGVHRSTLWRWLKIWEARGYTGYVKPIETKSSRPHTCPFAVSPHIVARISYWRDKHGRCAEIIHAHCLREGLSVSLSSVKRILRRLGFVVKQKWKRYRPHVTRPRVTAPGELVQTDTVHLVHPFTKQRVYLYTVIDLYSRWSYTEYHERISQSCSFQVLMRAQEKAGFPFTCVQADNGPEYGRWLTDALAHKGITLRHSRVRRPNDNAHIERFNRTIQEECLHGKFPEPEKISEEIKGYLAYYNTERLHLSLECRTPEEVLQRS